MYDEFIEDEIISIEELPDEVETMDIEVDGDHLFEAEGILTHNSGYDHKEGLSLTQLSESIKKVEHSDFVALIRAQAIIEDNNTNVRSDQGQLTIHIGKNRSGPKDKVITLKTKFSNFRIDDNQINTSVPFSNNAHDLMMDDLSI
jgi:replicative DNA helicase